jgi:hypothetical protein
MDAFLALAIGLLFWGPLLIRETVLQWRQPVEDNYGLLDRAMNQLMRADKLPPTWFDRALNRFRLVRKAVYGTGCVVVGGLILLSKLEII